MRHVYVYQGLYGYEPLATGASGEVTDTLNGKRKRKQNDKRSDGQTDRQTDKMKNNSKNIL
jgi:hypothetical protein